MLICYNISVLKYGRNMENNGDNTFYNEIKLKHKKLKMTECVLYFNINVPAIGASPHMTYNCCPSGD